jgi:hypothetical protein
VLWARAGRLLKEVDVEMTAALTGDRIAAIVDLIPERWLIDDDGAVDAGMGASRRRDAYRRYLIDRLAAPRPFVEEAFGAR